jgi:hypothetical protein
LERQRQADARGLETGSVALRMPLVGRWTVYQGFDGPHTHVSPRQHALDFHLLEEGRAFRGEGVLLEDYYAFDQPVLSPVYGWVVACRSDLPDNLPGEVDVLECWGNYVLIALASGDYVLLAHLRQASVCVVTGTALVPGREVGRCGNSGRSPTPHLHIHVQTTAILGGPTRPFHLSGIVNAAAGTDEHKFPLRAVPAAGDDVWSPSANAALARALHWPVGRRLAYAASLDGGPSHAAEIEVSLDSDGMFRARGANDASIAFVETADLVALYDRAGGDDPVLDCFALALGVTPLATGALHWSDVPPLRLLPAPFPVKVLCWLIPALGVTESQYERHWDASALLWRQTGRHRLRFAGYGLWSCRTEASITANVGMTAVAMSVDRKNANIVDAKLNGVGMRGDRGIPEWLSRW